MLGVIYHFESRLMTVNLDRAEPQIPSLVAFQISVTIQNLVIHQCIVDEGASTYVMPNKT